MQLLFTNYNRNKIKNINKRSTSKERHIKTLIVADKSMKDHYDYIDLDAYLNTIVNIVTGQITTCAQYSPPEFGGATPVVEIDNDIAIIETGVFCGKPATASVFVSPENYNKLLKLV